MTATAFLAEPKTLKYFTPLEKATLDPMRIPRHIAIMLDGNRRWAKKASEKINEGHRSGADNLPDILKAALELGVRYMTMYVFSTENWNRSYEEVQGLMWLFETYIRKLTPEMVEQNVRFHTIGDISKFPEPVLEAIDFAKNATKDCQNMDAIFAMNYGARDEIKRAFQKMMQAGLQPEEISEKTISQYLDTGAFPDPDLLIRTGGDHRISNFLLWQLSYAEIYLTETFWPDFSPGLLLKAVQEYQQRERRMGA